MPISLESSTKLRKLTASAIFLSLALALQFIFPNFYIPLLGQNGMRIGISGIFSIMPSILFGPIYGAATSALADILGYLFHPTGPYLPQMTLVVALGGAIRGFIWFFLKSKKERPIRIAVIVLAVLVAAFGLWSFFSLSIDGIGADFYDIHTLENIRLDTMQPISRLLISRTMIAKDPGQSLSSYTIMLTIAPLIFSGFSLLLFPLDFLIRKISKLEENKSHLLPILIAMLASGMIVTTLNTVILQNFLYESWKSLPFFVLWLPRAIEEILSNTVKVYFVCFFYNLFLKNPALKRSFLA